MSWNKNNIELKPYKFISFVPAMVIIVGIFCFSSQNALESSSLSGGVVENLFHLVEKLFNWNLPQQDRIQWLELFETVIRKAAHMTVYAMLGAAVAYSLHVHKFPRPKLIFLTEIFCMFYATTDEIHQLFVPGRSGQITDVLIDSIGAMIGIILLLIVKKGVRHH